LGGVSIHDVPVVGAVMPRAEFEADICFLNMDDAKGAEDDLRAAGFKTEITDAVDEYSAAVFMIASRANAVDLIEEVNGIIDPFHGFVSEWMPPFWVPRTHRWLL
jgi:hypothetical protein